MSAYVEPGYVEPGYLEGDDPFYDIDGKVKIQFYIAKSKDADYSSIDIGDDELGLILSTAGSPMEIFRRDAKGNTFTKPLSAENEKFKTLEEQVLAMQAVLDKLSQAFRSPRVKFVAADGTELLSAPGSVAVGDNGLPVLTATVPENMACADYSVVITFGGDDGSVQD